MHYLLDEPTQGCSRDVVYWMVAFHLPSSRFIEEPSGKGDPSACMKVVAPILMMVIRRPKRAAVAMKESVQSPPIVIDGKILLLL
jgi:hypothetical protein